MRPNNSQNINTGNDFGGGGSGAAQAGTHGSAITGGLGGTGLVLVEEFYT